MYRKLYEIGKGWSGLDGGSSRDCQMDARGESVLDVLQRFSGQAIWMALRLCQVAFTRARSRFGRVSQSDDTFLDSLGGVSLSLARRTCDVCSGPQVHVLVQVRER